MKRILLALLLAISFAACGDSEDGDEATTETEESTDTTAAAGANNVTVKDFQFTPSDLEVKAGATVVWKFDDSTSHSVVGEGFESETMQDGTFEHTFADAGTFSYQCGVHSTMKGAVTVS